MPDGGNGGSAEGADTLGHFRLIEKIGEGGAGSVYLAADLEIPGRRVALKVLKKEGRRDLGQLRREAAALASLQHPGILVVHEVGRSDRGPYLAMEHMEGGSLADRMGRGPLPLPETLRLARAAADAVRAAHEREIVHRDLKPANLLLSRDGHLKVADFGLAVRLRRPPAEDGHSRSTTTSLEPASAHVVGTPGYIAPEVIQGEEPGPASDQFAFGVALHEMLSGRHPFDGVAWDEMVFGARPRIADGLPADLRAIVARCLAAEPEERHAGMDEVLARLDAAIRRRDPARRRQRRVLLTAAVLLALMPLAWLGYRWLGERRARDLNEAGVAALGRGDAEAAYRAFLSALVADPRSEAACKNLGMLSLSEGNPARAVTTLEECVRSFPRSVEVLAGLGVALRESGDAAGAVERLREALGAGPAPEREPLIRNELARTLLAEGRAEEAITVLGEKPLPPDVTLEGAILHKTLGLALSRAGRTEEAIEVLARVAALSLPAPVRGEALVGLGEAREAAGDRVGARKAYSEALLVTTEPDLERKAREGLERVSAIPAGP